MLSSLGSPQLPSQRWPADSPHNALPGDLFQQLEKRPDGKCNACKHQTGFTAGTIFHSTKLPLVRRFRAIYELTQAKGGISSIELARRLGVRQPTAWLMKQKLMVAMEERDAGKPKMSGRVATTPIRAVCAAPASAAPPRPADRVPFRDRIGGLLAFDGAASKKRFVAVVETTLDRQPKRLKLQVVKGFRKIEIARLAQSSFAAGTNVVSDGLSCWKSVETAGCDHFPMLSGSGKQAAQWPSFNWVNTTLGNIETALAGTYHHVSQKHAQRYLASFAWRFNRRVQLDTITERLMWAGLQAKPRPYRIDVAQ